MRMCGLIMNLYSKHSQEFSNTRQAPWKGWYQAKQFFPNNPSILDIGCGNGRFLAFLQAEKIQFHSYLGIDNSEQLLKIARSLQSKIKNPKQLIDFLEKDVENSSWISSIDMQFDVIVAFGLLHHIHTLEQRIQLFQSVESLLHHSGIFIVTLWQYDQSERFTSKIIKDLGDNSYMLSFGNKGAQRFVHFTHEEELDSIMKQTNLKIVDSFEADGKEQKLNKYLVIAKA